MANPNIDTLLLEKVQDGDSSAAQVIWEEYFNKLLRLAQRKLGGLPRRVADEEDVALSAMNSFLQGARHGKFPQLADEDDLWRLLVTITARKAHAQQRRHFAEKRGGGAVRGESVFFNGEDSNAVAGMGQVLGSEPTPQFAAEVAEEFCDLLDRLEDPTLQSVAHWKMEGYTNEEIAEKLGRNVRTVERKLALIRQTWSVAD